MKNKTFWATLLGLSLILTSCGEQPPVGVDGTEDNPTAETELETSDTSGMDFEFSNRDNQAAYPEAGATHITMSDTTSCVDGNGATASGANVTITAAGTYIVSGSSSNARITVEIPTADKLRIVLDGVSVTSSDGPALYIKSAEKVFLTLADGTSNLLADGTSYELTDGDTTLDAALFSREDITINGSGSLTVNGNYKHGIVSKDDLIITGGTLNVTANNVGLCGKDCVKISTADITIDAGTDGIRSDNAEDAERGYVYVESGTLNIIAGNDGIQAETVLNVAGGTFTIATGGGSANASSRGGNDWNPMWGMWGGSSSSANEESAKGLKASSDILISGGTFTIDSSDDSIHSNGTVSIADGSFTIKSGDDGIHADTDLGISGGTMVITKSYEGIEASKIVISGGNLALVASDDGLNAAGGNDQSAMGGRPGMGSFTRATGEIVITGGYLLVNASGDGVDSNGTITISGGVTLVSGPTNSGNGALDYEASATVTGGVFIALGASGMATGFTNADNQGAILISVGSQGASKSLAICNEDGTVLASFTPVKSYQSAVITAPGIESGKSYTLVVGATVANADSNGYAQNTTCTGGTTIATLNMNGLIYGSSGGMGPGGMKPGGMGGRPR